MVIFTFKFQAILGQLKFEICCLKLMTGRKVCAPNDKPLN